MNKFYEKALASRENFFGRVGFASSRPFTHWVTLTCFKRCLLYSRVPDLSRHDNRLVRFIEQFKSMNFANDRVMEQQLEGVKKELLTKTAEEYRDSAVARARLKNGLAQLANQAKQLARSDATELVQRFGELGRRKFNLAA